MRKVKNRAFLPTLIISLALLMILSGALPVSAAEGGETQVTATTELSVQQGESGKCYVYIDSLEKLSSLIVTVYYDPNKVDVKVGNVFNVAPSLLYDKVVRQDNVQFSYIFDGNGSAEKTQLFYFEYTVLADAQGGETYFDIVVSEAYDSTLAAVPVFGSRCHFSIPSVPVVITHNYTRQVITEEYKKSDATCTAPAIYYYCCDTCEAKGETTFEYGDALNHTGGNATCSEKAICARCNQPYGELLSHAYTAEDALPAYLKSAATCTGKAVYYKNCIMCNLAGSVTFEYGDKEEHTYTNACDTDCNVCGSLRAVAHSYRAEWSKDVEGHWYECSVCGDKKEKAAHAPGAEATETTDQVCTVCGYVIQEALGHIHSHSATQNDEINHWNECVCGDKANTVPHTWDAGVITKDATYEEEGEKTYTCRVCLYTKRESIEKLVMPETEEIIPDSGDETETDMVVDDELNLVDDRKDFGRIALIGAIALVVPAIIIIFFVRRKVRARI